VEQLLEFLDSEYDQGYKPSTLHRRKISIIQFADYLVESNILHQNSLEQLSAWKPEIWHKIKQRELQFLSEEEIQLLCDTILHHRSLRMYRDISIISVLLETALSIDPIVKLNVSDLELRTLHVRVNLDKGYSLYPIPDSADYLKNYLEKSRPELTQSANEEALFVSQMGSRITRQGVWQVIKGWGREAQLDTPISPRVLRHTAVVLMLKSGKSTIEIQKLLGHTNVFSTKALIRKLEKSIANNQLEVNK